MSYKLNPITGKMDFYIASHLKLSDIGTRTHAQIDTKLDGIEDGATADQTKADIDGLGLSHDSLVDVSANDHHNELHSIASHSDTIATGAQLDTLVDNSIANALHRHSELVASDGSPDPALIVNAGGSVTIVGGVNVGDQINAPIGGGMRFARAGTAEPFLLLENDSGNNALAQMRGVNGGGIRFSDGGASVTWIQIDALGRVGIGATSPATSAKLELSSTTGALLLTRMTTAQKNTLTAVNGMLLYDSTLNKFQGYENGSWTSLI